ncbi:cell shape-determining protein MreC [Spirochaetota bacterium]|nr:cell shape-determining protein MreC [Spirochaetota bacterium]
MAKRDRRYFNLLQIIVIGFLFPITFLFLDASDSVDFRGYFMSTYRYLLRSSHENMASVNNFSKNLYRAFTEKVDQEDRISRLERQVIRQQLILDNLLISKTENERLTELLALKEELDFAVTFASVIGYDPENHFTTLIIDKGSEAGVELNRPVLAYQNKKIGLVGFILQHDKYFSEIRTILDQRTQISVNLTTYDSLAIARGQSRANILLEVDFIDIGLENLLYEEVHTSGLGQRYPLGILIGNVVEVDHAKYGLFQKAYLKPVIDFYSLREVFILTEDAPITAEQSRVNAEKELYATKSPQSREQFLSGIRTSLK